MMNGETKNKPRINWLTDERKEAHKLNELVVIGAVKDANVLSICIAYMDNRVFINGYCVH